MILNADDSKPTVKDIKDIKKTACIHCECPYDPERKITYTRTARGKVLWWHRRTAQTDSGLVCQPVPFNRKEYIREYQRKHYIKKPYGPYKRYVSARVKYMNDLNDF